ncbi:MULTISPECIES: quinolinate synthase NadA [unclassified Hyphomicrobium]|uniref:quinolinate synthase NadA n=1 Tax=unclassified Hyphomicrobium TaxID=2619925 RepID=UPI000213F6CF|nr:MULTISPECIES: quinolinate synthase NadA [unclassified Hyphomicrobium]CCB66191.1 putative quinolinate synthetase A (nadA-like) [Hyphomicrobium sp. MC1]
MVSAVSTLAPASAGRGKARTPLAYSWSPALEKEMAPLYARVKHVITPMEWPYYAPLIKAINELKVQRNAVILAHNYMTPEIFHCVSDFRGDSLQLAKEAARVDAKVIVQAGVHFMAETSKLLSPEKTVLIPDMHAGCSLASSITPEDVRMLREAYPGVPIVTYVNTSAAVKAECDITCTSANAVKVVESLGVPRVLCIPDQYLAKWVQSQTNVEVITWKGSCEVHERFTGEELQRMRADEPGLKIIAHPECPPDVIAAADFTGSTSGMIKWVKDEHPRKVMLVTECSMASNVAVEAPEVEFIRPCNLCPHMKRISLENIYDSLVHMQHEVTVDPDIAARARRAVERMVNLTN